MSHSSVFERYWQKANVLRWEIGVALFIKVLLLTALWFLIFRWQDRPTTKPNIADRFSLTAEHASPVILSRPLEEPHHDR